MNFSTGKLNLSLINTKINNYSWSAKNSALNFTIPNSPGVKELKRQVPRQNDKKG